MIWVGLTPRAGMESCLHFLKYQYRHDIHIRQRDPELNIELILKLSENAQKYNPPYSFDGFQIQKYLMSGRQDTESSLMVQWIRAH